MTVTTRLARHRTTLLVVAVAVVAVLLTAWVARGRHSYAASLDPANPDGNGAQALARVLDREGVAVDVVRSAHALDRAAADASTTIVVTSAGNLGRSTTRAAARAPGARHARRGRAGAGAPAPSSGSPPTPSP